MTIFVPEMNALVETRHDPEDNALDESLVARVGRKLLEHYPGFRWDVDIPPNQDIVKIRNFTLDPTGQTGMVAYKSTLDPGLKTVVRAAGELLERYNVRRGKHDPADVDGKVMHLARADDDPRLKKLSARLKAKHGGADG